MYNTENLIGQHCLMSYKPGNFGTGFFSAGM